MLISTSRLTRVAWIVLAGFLLSPALASAQIVASSADDICGPGVDPCVVTETVEVEDGTVLDFGLRAVRVDPGGLLDFADGAVAILCGSFSATTGTTVALRLRSDDGFGANVSIDARKACSGDSAEPCFLDSDCSALGKGSCTLGLGTVSLGGRVNGTAELSATFSVDAAGDISTTALIEMNGTTADSSGGDLDLRSALGSITLDGGINLVGGGFDSGGTVDLTAAVNIAVRGPVDVRGGEFDGGSFDASAGGELRIEEDILLDAKSNAGYGGSLTLGSGGDIVLTGGSAGNRVLLRSTGAGSSEDFGGDGGDFDIDATGSVFVGEFVKIVSTGAPPDAGGGRIAITGADVTMEGTFETTGPGLGSGGFIDLAAGTAGLTVTSTAQMDVAGGDFGAGDVTLSSDGDLIFDGRIDAAGGNGGTAGTARIFAEGAVVIGGTIAPSGDGFFGEQVQISGCNVVLESGASIDNRSTPAGNRITALGFMTIEADSEVRATSSGGSNILVHGTEAFPPSIQGTVSPAPTIVFDSELPDCPSCEAAPDCDDINPCTDDSCDLSIGCLNVANTDPCDDGNSCTTGDVCMDGSCVGEIPAECDDGNPCTDDSCLPEGGCVNVANSAPCDDGSACTVDDTCVAEICLGTPPPGCDDGNPCTRDSCDDSVGCVATEEPALACLESALAQVQLNNKPGVAKDSLKWKWSKGEAFSAADVGSPSVDTNLTLCVYDFDADASRLATRIDIAAGAAWSQSGSGSFKYKDSSGASGGVTKGRIRPGEDGKTAVQLAAKGPDLSFPSPVGSGQFFTSDPEVVVQLVGGNGTCWNSTFTNASKNKVAGFKAKAK